LETVTLAISSSVFDLSDVSNHVFAAIEPVALHEIIQHERFKVVFITKVRAKLTANHVLLDRGDIQHSGQIFVVVVLEKCVTSALHELFDTLRLNLLGQLCIARFVVLVQLFGVVLFEIGLQVELGEITSLQKAERNGWKIGLVVANDLNL
jgi:hypothetical protein